MPALFGAIRALILAPPKQTAILSNALTLRDGTPLTLRDGSPLILRAV